MYSVHFSGEVKLLIIKPAGFWGQRGRPQERKGPTIHTRLEVTLEDFYNGADIDVDVSRWHICPRCRGTGAKDASDLHVCEACKGTGMKVVRHKLAPGMYQEMQTTYSSAIANF